MVTLDAMSGLRLGTSEVGPWGCARADVFRLFGRFSWGCLLKGVLTVRELRPILTFRLCQRADAATGPLRPLAIAVAAVLHRWATQGAGMDLPHTARVGPGLRINHGWGLVVNNKASIGSNVTLLNGVVIAQKDRISADGTRTTGYSSIGDDVWIGPHAIILGVSVGDGSIIGAGAVVTRNIPPRSVVAGNPARILGEVVTPDVPNRFLLSGSSRP
jgi:serine O-acetyltransferase